MSSPDDDPQRPVALISSRPGLTVRLRLTLSYAAFLVAAGAVVAAILYLAMRWVPNFPLTSANRISVASRQEILDALVRLTGLALLLLAVIGLWGGWIVAGRVLRPLQQITAAARLAAGGSLDHRIGLTGRRDEFTDLSDTFDTMLDRLQRSFQEHQRFAANASHELRTPHAITNTMLEVALADPDGQDFRELTRRLHDTNRRGIEIVEALLALSALSDRTVEKRAVDLAVIVGDALNGLQPEAVAAGISLRSEVGESLVVGNDVLLHQLVTNLGQNGIRHNVGAGGTVSVSARVDPADARRVVLVVGNTGAIIPPAQARTFVEPFVRGQGRLATSGTRRDHGLGLALVAKIVDTHAGILVLRANPTGGLTVTVSLPRADPTSDERTGDGSSTDL